MSGAPTSADIKTACAYCGVGCGVIATPDGQGGAAISGDVDHPANFGRLCSKGSALGETLDLEGRLLAPQIKGRETNWDEALDLVAAQFREAIAEHGPDSVAFYVSGQFLTEDYYVANKLMKGYFGSANIDTNSRLCMASSVAGHKRAFGTDTVPGTYEDLDTADVIVLVGSNLAWCHPVLHQRIIAANRAKIVVVDPRRSATADGADLHLPIAPGGDVALFSGLLRWLSENGALDHGYIADHTNGFGAALDQAISVDEAAKLTGLPYAQLAEFYQLWTRTERVVTVYSQGVNQAVDGTDKVNAILNCHLATGRIGRVGAGPFSVTGQPNAMGGREVGGLANMLANHLDIENAQHRAAVQDFWDSPNIPQKPGLKAVDMFHACADGKIKALWIMCTNPAVSMPDADAVRAAIAAVPFTVVSDIMARTDTTQVADVLLPATGWGEKDGTVTNSERRISRQRAFLPAPGQARHDWDILCDVGRRMGYRGFEFQTPGQVFDEYARMTQLSQDFGRDLDLRGLIGCDYETLPPTQWPVSPNGNAGGRFYANGQFHHADRRAKFIAVHPAPLRQKDPAYPYTLNTGRIRDHWHTLTRTGKTPRLSLHIAEPFVEMHPYDAAALGIAPADLVRLDSPQGTMTARAQINDRGQKGVVFAPMHWTSEFSSNGRVDAVVADHVDPVSGQPELKRMNVAVSRLSAAWFGYAVCVTEPKSDAMYWAKARTAQGWQMELADRAVPEDWVDYAARVCGAHDAQPITMLDAATGTARIAFMKNGHLIAALFAAPTPVGLSRSVLRDMTNEDVSAGEALTARRRDGVTDPGAMICACFNVGVNSIVQAIAEQSLLSIEDVGAALNAGTNCGGCRPEIQALLALHVPANEIAAE